MVKPVFIINGSGGSGKDSFCKFCSQYLSVYNISSVDTIKEVAKILGWNGEKDEKSRYFLAQLKYLSSEYNDHPFKYIKKQIEYFKYETTKNIMFVHVREIDEIKKIKNEIYCKTILIKNDNVKKILSNNADANVENYDYDFVINNSGSLEDLRKEAFYFISEIWYGRKIN